MESPTQRRELQTVAEGPRKLQDSDPDEEEERTGDAEVTKVASIRELEDAIENAAPHIQITDHLDFTTSRDQSVLDLLAHTHSIRVRPHSSYKLNLEVKYI